MTTRGTMCAIARRHAWTLTSRAISRATHWQRNGCACTPLKTKTKSRTNDEGQRRRRTRVKSTRALVSIDLGPAAVLGTSLMLSAIALYQVRASRPEVSRDKDVFFSSIGLLCGGILVFQGWRLDPLMLFGQLLTAATAVAFATETISLRQELLDVDDGDEVPRPIRRRKAPRARARTLPPVTESRLEYGSGRRPSSWEQGDDSLTYSAARGSTRGAERDVKYDAYGSYSDIDTDFKEDVDLDNDKYDDESAFRDGFRTSLGDASDVGSASLRQSTSKSPSSKIWENDDWDFV